MSSILIISISLTLTSILAVLMNFSNFLTTLLNLEMMILGMVSISILTSALHSPSEIVSALIFLTFGACGASLGLSCLVVMMRSFGNDQMKALTVNKF